MEKPQQKIGEEQNYEELDKDQLVRLLAEQARTIANLRAALTKKESSVALSILHGDLPEAQREVLQAILDLPDGDDAFAEAEKLIGTLDGQPMTQVFCNSFKGVLKEKSLGVVCPKCQRPSILVWHANSRYSEGGNAEFSHASPGPHGGLTRIHGLHLVKKIDRRRKSS